MAGGLFFLIIIIATIAGWWKMFEKAGKPGWACLIPIYNQIVFLELIDKPLWRIILYFIPLVGIVLFIVDTIEFAKHFGKDAGWGVGLVFLGFIFAPLIGFSDAEWKPTV
jgi:hypothetical protein